MIEVHSDAVGVFIPGGDLSALIARLEAAEAGSRELDIAIMTLIGGARDIGDGVFYGPDVAVWHTSEAAETEGGYWTLPAPSTSLDAALALAERVLPDHMRGPITLCIAGTAEVYVDHVDPCGDSVKAFGKSPALALCIATLKAFSGSMAKAA